MKGILNICSFTNPFKLIPTQPFRSHSTLSTNPTPTTNTLPQRPTLRSSLKPLTPSSSIPTSKALSLIKSEPSSYIKASILGKLYRLSQQDVLTVPYIKDLRVGDVIRLTKLVEIGSRSFTFRSTDASSTQVTLDRFCQVNALVVEHSRGIMLKTVKKKRRKGYLKTIKNKPYFTKLRISGIEFKCDENSS
ncbi:uncharacterized protein MELLADRAFT_70685 [Melampsora larici-populina 98AG31]|uniref:Large ribosomal subunit protein bL21m n=1 Tax=Melampsora larici-populina (strain 98AG31 / pathotype 3-4-7) TaxID=747676 RepID=F4R5G0_MELLP|nr:uncharacterized protein MELLADRAFT_70685 [Melampsora larici-populina 98AG31]EGG12268.1 hypothetical protein MELLADRAFT_70685 [Melampsora larici-populina 98AG31]